MWQLPVTYLLTWGGAAAALTRPFLALLIYVGFAIITPEALWPYAVPRGNYSRIVAIGLLIGWALHNFGSWKFGRAKPVVVALLGFWGWSIVTSIFARDQDLAWTTLEFQSKIYLACLVGMTLLDSVTQLKKLVWVIVLTNGFLAYQFNTWYYTNPFFTPDDFTYRGLDNNSLSITMVTAIGPAFFLAMHADRWWQKGLALVSVGLMAHVVLFSMSRGGMVAMAVTGGVSFLLMPKTWKHYLFFALVLAVVLRLAGPSVVKRFDSSFKGADDLDASAESRVEQWDACINCIKSNPILGIGTRGWRFVAQEYGANVAREAHSTWLQVAAEMGLPGVGFLVLFYGSCALRLAPLVRQRAPVPDPWVRYLSRMVIASIAGFAVSSQFVTVDGIEMPYFIGMIGAGVLRLSEFTAPAAPLVPAPATPARVSSVPC